MDAISYSRALKPHFQQCSESLAENTFVVTKSTTFHEKCLGFSQYNGITREPRFVPGGLPCTFSFPGNQSF